MDAVRISKLLSLALRHQPDALGITLDAHGWTDIDGVLAGLARKGFALTADDLEEIVRTSDKQRFALSPDGARIRANQGHSVAIDLALPASTPPELLFHGTVARFLEPIRREGLLRRARTHVHLSVDRETAEKVAARRTGSRDVSPCETAPKDIRILGVRARAMHEAGFVFYVSDNGVWLTERVPTDWLEIP